MFADDEDDDEDDDEGDGGVGTFCSYWKTTRRRRRHRPHDSEHHNDDYDNEVEEEEEEEENEEGREDDDDDNVLATTLVQSVVRSERIKTKTHRYNKSYGGGGSSSSSSSSSCCCNSNSNSSSSRLVSIGSIPSESHNRGQDSPPVGVPRWHTVARDERGGKGGEMEDARKRVEMVEEVATELGKRELPNSLRTIAEFIPHSRTVTTPVATFNKYRINAFTGSTSTSPKPDSRPIVYVDQPPPPPPPPPPSTNPVAVVPKSDTTFENLLTPVPTRWYSNNAPK
ncbi:hypothetical protein M0802_007139 [Mischocyttarus mexicanus]|nr:hypothetical protein M0802_007139 [Mischocyttarus mexicanus]